MTIGGALLGGAVGFYAGLAALLAATGLDAPGWAPVAMVAGAGLFGGAAAGVAAGLPAPRVAAVGAVAAGAGGLAGLGVGRLLDSFEAAVVAAAVLALGAAVASVRIERTTRRRAPLSSTSARSGSARSPRDRPTNAKAKEVTKAAGRG